METDDLKLYAEWIKEGLKAASRSGKHAFVHMCIKYDELYLALDSGELDEVLSHYRWSLTPDLKSDTKYWFVVSKH